MIYVLGGAPRAGKTSLSSRVVAEKGMPYFPLDALLEGLVNGAPQLGVTYDQPFIERAEQVWPITKPLIRRFFHEERGFLIEGDSVLPSQVNELVLEGNQVKSCFIGYAELSKEEKLNLLRTYHQGELDWTKGIPDEDMLKIIDEMIQFSQFLKEECEKYQIPYFDVSHDFEKPREEAFVYLFTD